MKKYAVVVFENESRGRDREVDYVKGPFDRYEDARRWVDTEECPDEFEIALIKE